MVRIALAQVNTTVGDLRGNAGIVLDWMRRAEQGGADLVAFPELAISGYPPEDLLLRRRFVEDCSAAVQELAPRVGKTAVVVGFPHRTPGGLFNAGAILQDGEIRGIYHKILLPNYGVFDEKRYFRPGGDGLVVDIGTMRIALHICEDSWEADDRPTTWAVDAGVDAVLNLSASPYDMGKIDVRRQILEGVGRRCDCTTCYVNLVGGQDELVFDGRSMIVSPRGEIVGMASRFDEDLLLYDLRPLRSRRGPGSSPETGHPWKVIRLIHQEGKKRAIARGNRDIAEPSAEEEVYRALMLGTRDYLRKNGFAKAVLGLSGGIDSALTAAIACDALGAENVIGVTMPGPFTSKETREDAGLLARSLGIRLLEIPIGPVARAFHDALQEIFSETETGVAEENIQARIRGNLLMALSNKFGWIVLSTGNKSETAVGYCTLYGDTAGGLAVLKDVPKTMVYRLSRWRNESAGRPVIPESTMTRAPTAELRDDQKDSDSLPDYERLDAILEEHVQNDLDAEEITELLGDEETVRRVLRMVNRSEYKRRQGPPGIKITPKAFGKDRRLPITNRYSSETRG